MNLFLTEAAQIFEKQMQKLVVKQWEKGAVLVQRKHPFWGGVI